MQELGRSWVSRAAYAKRPVCQCCFAVLLVSIQRLSFHVHVLVLVVFLKWDRRKIKISVLSSEVGKRAI